MARHYNRENELLNHKLQAGQCLFREGDEGDVAYIINEGLIEISTYIDDEHTILNTLTTGEMFGELALVDGRPRSASAHAKTDVTLTVVTSEQVSNRIDDADPVLKLLLMVVMKYFRSETGRVRSNQIEKDYSIEELTTQKYQTKIIQAIELIRLESDLRNGFKKGELKLFFQPIIDLKTNLISGFEV